MKLVKVVEGQKNNFRLSIPKSISRAMHLTRNDYFAIEFKGETITLNRVRIEPR